VFSPRQPADRKLVEVHQRDVLEHPAREVTEYPGTAVPIAVPTISGACFAVSKADFAKLNGFDTRFFLHVEDVDHVGVAVEVAAPHRREQLGAGEHLAGVIGELAEILPQEGGLVVLDSDHSKSHVLKEMNAYQRFVAAGSYMVVEDTNINGHPVSRRSGPGPHEAVCEFLDGNNAFVRDEALWKRNKFSFHQGGWLRKAR